MSFMLYLLMICILTGVVNGHSTSCHDDSTAGDDVVEDEEDVVVTKTKFDWVQVITDVLKSKGEITLKKLRKKVYWIVNVQYVYMYMYILKIYTIQIFKYKEYGILDCTA